MSPSSDPDRDDFSSSGADEDERERLYLDESKPAPSPFQRRKRSGSQRNFTILGRVPGFRGAQRRTLIIAALVVVAILAIGYELAHINGYGAPPPEPEPESIPEPEPEPEQQEQPEVEVEPAPPVDHQKQCTTWPVSENGDYTSNVDYSKYDLKLDSHAPPGGWKKPAGLNVVGLIFYGRRRTVDILDCYLQQNLAVNGGYLDKVLFLLHTSAPDDLDYLDNLLKSRPQYQTTNPGACEGQDFSCMWNEFVDDDTIYIKIDDDIVGYHATNPFLRDPRILGKDKLTNDSCVTSGIYPP